MTYSIVNGYLKMTMDENAPILYTKVLALPQDSKNLDDLFVEHQRTLIEMAGKNGGIVYSICDTSGLQPYSFDLLINFYFHFEKKSKNIFQCHKIFVLPKKKGAVDINEILRIANQCSIYFFDSIEEAKKSVYDEWMVCNKPNSIRGVMN